MISWVGALRLQAIITGIVCASAMALAAPGNSGSGGDAADPDPSPSSQASRGGDLSRGIAFVLAPEWSTVYRNALRRIRDDVRAALSADDVSHDDLRISGAPCAFSSARPPRSSAPERASRAPRNPGI